MFPIRLFMDACIVFTTFPPFHLYERVKSEIMHLQVCSHPQMATMPRGCWIASCRGPKHISRELDGNQSNWDLNWHPYEIPGPDLFSLVTPGRTLQPLLWASPGLQGCTRHSWGSWAPSHPSSCPSCPQSIARVQGSGASPSAPTMACHHKLVLA